MQRTASRSFLVLMLVAAAAFPAAALAEPAGAASKVVPAPTARFDAVLEGRRVRLVGSLKAGQRAKLEGAIQDVLRRAQPPAPVAGKPAPPAPDVAGVARSAVAGLAKAEGIDPETLVAIVLLEAAKAADRDLAATLAELKAASERKAAMRAALAALKSSRESTKSTKACATFTCLDALPVSAEYTKADLEAVKQSLAGIGEGRREDTLSELGEQAAAHMQVYQDRYSRFLATLSNLLKKASDTSAQITQNLK